MRRFLLALSVLTFACSSSTSTSSADDAAVDAEPEAAPSEVGGTCNGVDLGDAPTVHAAYGPGKLPTAEGGTIADGAYALTSIDVYGVAGRSPTRQVVVISGASAEDTITGITLEQITRRSASLAFDGTNVTFAYSCPSSFSKTVGYTGKDGSFLLFDKVGSATFVSTYTRR